jgi:hypothetical protein
LTREYLSYPKVPGISRVSVLCISCDDYFRVALKVEVTLEAVDEPTDDA